MKALVARSGVTPLVGVALMTVAAAFGLRDALIGIHENWTSVYGHFAHGYLVLAMALWLACVAWRDRVALRIEPWWPALPVLVLLLLALIASLAMDVESLFESLVPLIVLAAVAASLGVRVARLLLWPVLFLYFALPIWWVINTPLQQLTSAVVNRLVVLSGVPAFVEGNFFHLPFGTIQIASLCSGLNYLVSALALAFFQGMLYLPGWRDRIKLLAVAAALALVCNWVRIYSLLVIAYFSDMRNYLIRVEHVYYGWVLFLLFMWPMFRYGARLESRQGRPARSQQSAVGREADTIQPRAQSAASVVVAAALLSPLLLRVAMVHAAGRIAPLEPLIVAGESATAADTDLVSSLKLPGAREERSTAIVAGRRLEMYRAYIPLQREESEIPASGFDLLGAGWHERGPRTTPAVTPGGLRYEQQAGMSAGRLWLVRTGVVVAGAPATGPMAIKIAALQGLLRLRGDGLVWLVAVPCRTDCTDEAAELDEFLRRHGSALAGIP